tara:strand:+ start:414 stop:917 length:504 start_codon:yes stop_codon:yes gene_type:complete
MLLNLRNNLHWVSLILGIVIYPYILDTSLALGIVWLIFILYFWLTISMICNVYKLDHFLFSVCSIGILIAISIFFIHGIEEAPLPVGAIIFKAEGIAQALLVFFIFTVPLIIYKHQGFMIKASSPSATARRAIKNQALSPLTQAADEDWEEATIEDLESGDFEISEQ